ncbi:MAG: Ltp family lipoprotein [Saccharofermentanales bacterium]
MKIVFSLSIALILCLLILIGCAEKNEKTASEQTTTEQTTAVEMTTTIVAPQTTQASEEPIQESNNLLNEYDAFIEEMKKESERLEDILDEGDRIKGEYYKWISESIDFVKPLLEAGVPAKDELIRLVETWIERGDIIAIQAIAHTDVLFSDISKEMAAIVVDGAKIHRDNYLSVAEELLDKLKSSHFSADEVYELYEKIVGHLLSLANPSAVETASTPTETKTEDVSTERQNALRIAEDFLSTIPLSKEGLYDQLLFQGCSKEAARYVVDNIEVNWKDQALRHAKVYLNITSFSKEDLYDQLLLEKYTREEAAHAVSVLFN